ncbi:hypothetical protein [Sphingomonas crusticola]|uniref:hypothetical protein n=1 Tax=Sphingomonas crusticola TaxID=1697973 RepID=UPI000E27A5C0|nr:hypothetical protein [Sphingomonas crusticola]
MKLWQLVMLAGMTAAPLEARDPPTGSLSSDAIEMPLSSTIQQYKKWRIEQNKLFVAAVTTNEAGSLFGLLCGTTCSYYINNGKACEVGVTYPGLISGANGALAVTLRCLHVREEGEEYAVFLVDEDVTEMLGEAAEIGIVVPLANGQFNVSRFSMAGASEALDDMFKIADKKIGATDFTL